MKKMVFRNYILCSLLLLLASCITQQPSVDESQTKRTSLSEKDTSELAALAFISYAGEKLKGSNAEVEQKLWPCVVNELKRQSLTKGKYQLVWGPAVYKFPLAELDDNMMYVVKDIKTPGNLVIATRGTNGGAALDWIVEDFYVSKTVKWGYGNNVPAKACISEGTNIGLNILQQLKPVQSGVPGYNTTVVNYLAEAVKNDALNQITVVGHSLSGALAPVYALWLKDTQSDWDPSGKVQIKVTALAGPTPGNKKFSKYYGTRLKQQTNRLHNPYDAVPQAWYLPTLKQIPYLYTSAGIDANSAEKAIIDLGVEISRGTSYTQIVPAQAALSGNINNTKGYKTFVAQVAWQHSCGYYCALGIANNMFKTNSTCVSPQFCRQNPTNQQCINLGELTCPACP